MSTHNPTTGVVERVPAHDLKVDDTIVVAAVNGEYIGSIVAIEEYAVFMPIAVSKYATSEANGRCLCIRLPKLNIYRARHDTVRRIAT